MATSEAPERLWAVRGAVQAERNDAESILAAAEVVVRELLERNRLSPDRVVSVFFTCTDDLDAEFPAVAARRLGLSAVPLICAQEIDVPGALPRVIRLMVHCYASDGSSAQHVYLREAAGLRRDLEGAQ